MQERNLSARFTSLLNILQINICLAIVRWNRIFMCSFFKVLYKNFNNVALYIVQTYLFEVCTYLLEIEIHNKNLFENQIHSFLCGKNSFMFNTIIISKVFVYLLWSWIYYLLNLKQKRTISLRRKLIYLQ